MSLSVGRFVSDRCLIGASALSYATLVSLVPLTALALVIFSGFEVFGDLRLRLLGLALENFNALGTFRTAERKVPIDEVPVYCASVGWAQLASIFRR